jgi:hypothetical protein
MKRTFVYTSWMQQCLQEFSDPETKAREIENAILEQPEIGAIVTGTGGVRKFRLADEGRSKGKRGGIRVFFLDLPHIEITHLIFVLRKGEAEDLLADEKKAIKELVLKLKKESMP